MEPLLNLTSIPIEYELQITDAVFEVHHDQANVVIEREKGGLHIKSEPVKLKLDTVELRKNMFGTTRSNIQKMAQRGKDKAFQAGQNYSSDGARYLKSRIGEGGNAIGEVVQQRSNMSPLSFNIAFTPKVGPNIEWIPPELSIRYEMDKLNFDVRVDRGEIKFIPGNVEISISRYPELRIEYTGEPVYIPAREESSTGIDKLI